MSIFELNMANAKHDVGNTRVNKDSKIVEVFSALVDGRDANVDATTKDACVKNIKEIASKAAMGDAVAVSEINAIIRFAIEPKLLQSIKVLPFMGTFKTIGYNEAPMMQTYAYESIDSRFQASSGDVPFAHWSYREYPIGTQTISSGFAVDYRELQSGNFNGSVAEGMSQVQIDMQNKVVYYVIYQLYQALKNANGVHHYAEGNGITKSAVDAMLKAMRRYGKVNIAGDYSVVSQLNDFVGFRANPADAVRYGSENITDEIVKNGLIAYYNGANVVEIPNALNFSQMKADKSAYELYMPEGLLFFLPQGAVSPLQMFQRGGLTTMNGEDIVTRQYLTRFDLEIGAGVAEGMEDQIGLVRDLTYPEPTIQ